MNLITPAEHAVYRMEHIEMMAKVGVPPSNNVILVIVMLALLFVNKKLVIAPLIRMILNAVHNVLKVNFVVIKRFVRNDSRVVKDGILNVKLVNVL